MGPELTLNFEDGDQVIWLLAVNGTEPKLQISDGLENTRMGLVFSHRNYCHFASEECILPFMK